jgi:transposase InsO family protein
MKKQGKKYIPRQKLELLKKWQELGGTRADAERLAYKKHCCPDSLYRWKKAYNLYGVKGLENKSQRPHTPHPTQHTAEEMNKIAEVITLYPHKSRLFWHGKLRAEYGYSRSFDGMCYRIRLDFLTPKPNIKFEHHKRPALPMIGIESQLDVKYVPPECMSLEQYIIHQRTGLRYYQYSIIDICSRELFIYFYDGFGIEYTIDFLSRAYAFFGYKFHYVRTDRGKEFTNEENQVKSAVTKMLEKLGATHITNTAYSPWKNGIVERVHRTCNEEFYKLNIGSFTSLDDLRNKGKNYLIEYNTMRVHSALKSNTGKRYITPQQKRNELLQDITTITITPPGTTITRTCNFIRSKQNIKWSTATRNKLYQLPDKITA